MSALDFSNYFFEVRNAEHDPFEFNEEEAMSYDQLYASLKLTYHTQVLNFVAECQTYPSAQARCLALELAKNFRVAKGSVVISQTTLGHRLGLGANAVRKYTQEVLDTGYWEQSIDTKSQTRVYKMTRNTLIVFSKWRRIDTDKLISDRWGYGTPVVMQKANMAREVNKLQGLAKKRQAEKQARIEAQKSVPPAKTYADVLDYQDKTRQAQTAQAADALFTSAMKAVASGSHETAVLLSSNIAAHTAVVHHLSIKETQKLFNQILDEHNENHTGMEGILIFANNMMESRKKAKGEQANQDLQVDDE